MENAELSLKRKRVLSINISSFCSLSLAEKFVPSSTISITNRNLPDN